MMTVYLRRSCGLSAGLTAFLNTLGVPHRTRNIDLDPEAFERIRPFGSREETPYLDFGDGRLLKMPTNQEVQDRLEHQHAIPPAKAA